MRAQPRTDQSPDHVTDHPPATGVRHPFLGQVTGEWLARSGALSALPGAPVELERSRPARQARRHRRTLTPWRLRTGARAAAGSAAELRPGREG